MCVPDTVTTAAAAVQFPVTNMIYRIMVIMTWLTSLVMRVSLPILLRSYALSAADVVFGDEL